MNLNPRLSIVARFSENVMSQLDSMEDFPYSIPYLHIRSPSQQNDQLTVREIYILPIPLAILLLQINLILWMWCIINGDLVSIEQPICRATINFKVATLRRKINFSHICLICDKQAKINGARLTYRKEFTFGNSYGNNETIAYHTHYFFLRIWIGWRQ